MQRFNSKIIHNRISKVRDPWPSSSRGMRTHYGVNMQVTTNEKIYAPIPGQVIRKAFYEVDGLRCGGLFIKGRFEWSNWELKIFNIAMMASGNISHGELIGRAQNLNASVLGATNHIHVEVKRDGINIDPYNLWRMFP